MEEEALLTIKYGPKQKKVRPQKRKVRPP